MKGYARKYDDASTFCISDRALYRTEFTGELIYKKLQSRDGVRVTKTPFAHLDGGPSFPGRTKTGMKFG
ncbi:hypothetical protein ACIGFK_41110 [Streptomyces sp. NPDC085524]|uniref:hypothetical protein n=1 Tax=Streptomyces sp. NPDC085524 TaxID=3365728 RepID=UPI0037D0A498